MSQNISSQITPQETMSERKSFSDKDPLSSAIIKVAATGVFFYGCGTIEAAIGGISPLYAVVVAISAMSLSVINQVVDKLQEKYDIKDHKVILIKAATTALVAVATLIALVTLGVLGPAGIGVFAGLSGLYLLYSLGCAYASYKATLAPLADPQTGVAR